MWFAVLAVALSSAPSPQIKAALAGFRGADLDDKKVSQLGEFFAEQLSRSGGFPVTTPSEIQALIGLERQKQLLGCSDEASSCMAELAGALGVDAVVTGNVTKLGDEFVCTVKISDTRNGATLASASTQVAKESDLGAWLRQQAQVMGPLVRQKLGGGAAPEAATSVSSGSAGASSKAWIPLTAGAALLVGGGVCYGIAANKAAGIESKSSPYDSRTAAEEGARSAATFQTIAFVAGGAGLAAVAVGGVMMAFGKGESETIAVSPAVAPNGVGFAVGGRF